MYLYLAGLSLYDPDFVGGTECHSQGQSGTSPFPHQALRVLTKVTGLLHSSLDVVLAGLHTTRNTVRCCPVFLVADAWPGELDDGTVPSLLLPGVWASRARCRGSGKVGVMWISFVLCCGRLSARPSRPPRLWLRLQLWEGWELPSLP